MDWSAHEAGIHAAFADPISYRQQGQSAVDCTAVVYFPDADDLPSSGGGSISARGYELPQAYLSFAPRKGDVITEGAASWRVIQVMRHDAASAWRLAVERLA
jgi:hypothetical protein